MHDDAKQPGKASVLDVALAAHAAGLSVLPPHPTEKRPRLDWLRYQSEQMPVEQLRDELTDRLGIVTGYGNVEAVDFDLAGFACIAWRERAEAAAPGLVARLYVERSPSGGRHVIYRCSEIAGNTKLATLRLPAGAVGEHTVQRLGRPLSYTVADTDEGRMVTIGSGKPVKATRQRDGTMAAKVCPIETRGTGGWLIVAPSPGYVIERGSLADLPEITPAERQVLIDAAVALSDAEPVASVPAAAGPDSERPGDTYNASGDHVELLMRNGWTLDHTEGANEHWTRPGKDSGTSATWHTGKRTFYLFSSSVGELEPEQGHSLFAVRAALEHAGDLSACARAIRAEQRPVAAPTPTAAEQRPEPRIILRSHADRMRERFTPPPMLIAGCLPRGAAGAIFARPGAGKSLVGVELARCVASGDPFAGRSVEQGRVIYCCQDSPASTERRMLAIDADVAANISTVCRLPSLPGGLDDLRAAVEAVNTSPGLPLRLLVLDTWDSARSHSDGGWAGQDGLVEGIMSGLRQMAEDYGIGVIVVHHTTRGDDSRARGSAVFDAKCDWMASVTGDGHTVALESTKVRDGEQGRVGSWRITAVAVGEAMVPILATVDAEAHPVATTDADALVGFLASHDGKHTARTLRECLSLSGSVLERLTDEARRQGWIAPGGYSLTAAGRGRADDLLLGEAGQTGTPTGTPGQTNRDGAGQTANTVRPTGTDHRDAPSLSHRPVSIGNGRDGHRDGDGVEGRRRGAL